MNLLVGNLLSSPGPSRLGAIKGLFNTATPAALAVDNVMRAFLRRPDPLGPSVCLRTSVHTSTFAPPGAGKTRGLVIPFLRECEDSAVVLDVKPEIYGLTVEYRRKMGHKIVVLDPLHCVTDKPDCFNPLDFINPCDAESFERVDALAEAMTEKDPHARDKHWSQRAEKVISSIMLGVLNFAAPEHCNLSAVYSVLANADLFRETVRKMKESSAWDGRLAMLADDISRAGKEEWESIISNSMRSMRFLASPSIAESLSSSTFDPSSLAREKVTVYCIIPAHYIRHLSPLLRLFVTSLYRAVVGNGPQEKHLVHFVLDEAGGCLGQMDAIDDILSVGRGYGVRAHLFYQSWAQLKKCFPDNEQIILSNTTSIFFGTNDYQTAEEVSRRIGEHTIVVENGGKGTGASHSFSPRGGDTDGTNSSTNANWGLSPRRLLKPEEITRQHPRVCFSFVPGQRPILTWLGRCWEDQEPPPLNWIAERLKALGFALVCVLASLFILHTVARIEPPRQRSPPVKTEPTKRTKAPPIPKAKG